MQCSTLFNTLGQQELRAVRWQGCMAVQSAAEGTRTGQKESVREILTYGVWTEEES
jgi:hypothetical protein